MKLFNFDIHIGKWRVLVQTRDINDKAITGSKIADRVIDWFHIKPKAIRNEHIDDGAVNTRTLADYAVTSPKIKNGAVTPEKFSDRVVSEVIDPLLKPLKAKDADLQNQIDSFNEHGLSVSNWFGNDPHIGVSQKTLTSAFNLLWSKMEDITGESYRGISMVVTPEYFIGDDGCTVNVKAYTANTIGIFEHIEFLIDDQIVHEAEDAEYVEFTTEIDHSVQITCNAQIMGCPYTAKKKVMHYDAFWIGGGSQASDVMVDDAAHIVQLDEFRRAAKDVELTQGQHIIIVMGEYMRNGFIRADINGIEIGFTETQVTIDDNVYSVFTSENTYNAETINVDING